MDMDAKTPGLVRFRSALFPSLCAAVVALMAAPPAEAIPAFARKYQTSCQTCHIAFPKLNPFGETFRLRGYRMPGETEDMIKEPPVPLGAEAYKRVWPDAVWPSDIPGTAPFSLDLNFNDRTIRMAEEDGHGSDTIKNDFRFPESVGLLAAGTLGETMSFFFEGGFEQEVEDDHAGTELEIEHGQVNFNGPWGSGTAFNVKVGRFVPEITQPFGHSAVLTTGGPSTLLQFVPIAAHGGSEVGGHHGGAGIALPHSVDGIEAYGIVRQRFLYSGGISNGVGPGPESFDANNTKDVYGRVAYKVGGLPFDGEGYVPSELNWRETSLRLGAFAYRGDGDDFLVRGAGHHGDELIEDREFTRFGFDVNLFVRDLNFIAGFVRGRDTLAEYEEITVEPMEGMEEEAEVAVEFVEEDDFTYRTWFAEADYVLMPWLHGAVRYEWLDPANRRTPTFKRIIPNVTALIRANVKAVFEYQRDLDERDDYVLTGAVRVAF